MFQRWFQMRCLCWGGATTLKTRVHWCVAPSKPPRLLVYYQTLHWSGVEAGDCCGCRGRPGTEGGLLKKSFKLFECQIFIESTWTWGRRQIHWVGRFREETTNMRGIKTSQATVMDLLTRWVFIPAWRKERRNNDSCDGSLQLASSSANALSAYVRACRLRMEVKSQRERETLSCLVLKPSLC